MKKSLRLRVSRFALLGVVCGIGLASVSDAETPSANGSGRQAATVEDSVRLRTFVEENPVAVSPDGRRVAYVLTEPNLKEDYDETVVYVRELPAAGTGDSRREGGKAALRSRGIRQMQWLADGQRLLVLHHPDGGKGIVTRVDLATGEVSPASPRDMDVEEFAATPDGRRLALLVSVPDEEQADRFAAPRGVVIHEDDFLLDIDARGTAKKKASRMAVVAADVGGGAMTVFEGKRSLTLMRPAISPNGRYVTFHALGEALPYPPAWKKDPAFRQWPERGFVVPQNELVRAELPATISSRPRSGARSSPGEDAALLGLALDAGCISDQFWSMALLWSDDSASYLVCGPSPVGDGESVNERLVGPYRPHHLFAIDAKTGAAQKVMEETPRELLAFDEQARRIVLVARNGDLVTLRRADAGDGVWKEEQRTKLPDSGLRDLSVAPSDMNRFVGIHQTTTEPPDLWLLDVKTGHKTALTEINPELREQTLGRVEKIQWDGSNASRNGGYLIYPVGYEAGTRYPCVILCKSWDDTFIHGGNDGLRSNFAPQALANCGFVVLMLEDTAGPYAKGAWKDLPGGVSEAFRGMDAFETARRELDRRGLIDPARVGIMGFSRSSWRVDFTITHSRETWAAAVSADSGIYNYGTYLGDKNLRLGMAAMYGGPPSGDTFKAWLDYAPAFSAQRVRTPLLMQYHGKISMAAEFYSALVTQGKPVELIFFPDGKHILELPLQRIGSMQGSVDWFRFWLQGYENPNPQYPGQNARWRALRVQHERNERLITEGKDPGAELIGRQKLEAIRLSPDGKSFVFAESGKPFRVWGVNYDHDSQGENGRLLEDYWETEWDTVVTAFQEMKKLGANVVRIHLQVGKFMSGPDTPNEKSLAQLRRLLELAEQTGLYLDLTGLGCYRKTDTPAWYDAMDEAARWSVQGRFWAAVAKTCRDSHAVFCYDLMNEPIIDGKKDAGWVAGELGGKWFVQRLTLELGGRTPIEIAKAWVDKLTAAIHTEDRGHLITVGVIPWALVWPGAKPIFYSPEAGGALDFVSIHVYPKKGEVDRALAGLAAYDIGKPVVVEETFPLSCSIEEMDDFLKRSKPRVAGYLSFYWGRSIPEYNAATEKKLDAAIMAGWLRYFQQQAEVMRRP